ncbi:TIGR03619 family F420-dependent LLM class oxidoreductase [Novosphingobium sp. FGD1]|jgi:probable F420-dependent oxidoreductase|uniref:TIGR03619 family F420-dependent LLM class oxidoreductase n=1 Tax=Novosphingobium silvae TaxID=2692619 RepID=A0A7X4K6C6_9SPHN|nr:LLM class F420-dependent oxidoreductase [Novosphingobium silvae]MYL97015.1 TIGR03619 family F420-dependent LLM class oxidoreductase [Novosphingobium silvae]
MTFTLSTSLPFDHIDKPGEWCTMRALHEIARAVETAGFHAGTVTDHPVPSSRWLDNGGHYAQDPFVMLSMLGAATTTLRLQTNILVLPYRNPFITARAVSSLDHFTAGRVILGVGAGYMKGEYKALGVDFDRRNDIMDEYMKAMKLAWTGEDFTFEGNGYTAPGNRVRPTPAQTPHPPLLVGGNSKRALRRAVELGDAWHPFFVPKAMTDTARTASLEGDDDIVAAIAYMAEHCEKIGRSSPPQVIASSTYSVRVGWNPQEALDHFAHLKSLGVDGSGATIHAATRVEYLEQAQRFGEEVISRIDF